MKRLGNTFISAGIVLLVGPFFGFTIRGQQETGYGEGALLAIISIALGIILLNINKHK